jgi:hypothetical protein
MARDGAAEHLTTPDQKADGDERKRGTNAEKCPRVQLIAPKPSTAMVPLAPQGM